MPCVFSISSHSSHKADEFSIPLKNPSKPSRFSPVTIGAFTGFLVDTIANPLLRARTIQAVGGSPEYDGMVKTLKYIIKTEGVKGLYRGLPVLAVLSPIGTAVFFGTNYKVKEWAPRGYSTEFLAGVAGQLAGAVAGWVPCAAITEGRHLTKAQSDLYSLSTKDLIKRIATHKGILGFYPAFWTQNIAFSLFNGFGMATSSKITSWLKDIHQRDLHPLELACSNAVSFGIAAGGTTSIDTIKIRYQTDSVSGLTSISPFTTVKNMYYKEGIGSFWKGFWTRIFTLAPRQAIVVSAVQYFVKTDPQK